MRYVALNAIKPATTNENVKITHIVRLLNTHYFTLYCRLFLHCIMPHLFLHCITCFYLYFLFY
jgi:hypothetical protein